MISGKVSYLAAFAPFPRRLHYSGAIGSAIHEIAQKNDSRFAWWLGSIVIFDGVPQRPEQIQPAVDIPDDIETLAIWNSRVSMGGRAGRK